MGDHPKASRFSIWRCNEHGSARGSMWRRLDANDQTDNGCDVERGARDERPGGIGNRDGVGRRQLQRFRTSSRASSTSRWSCIGPHDDGGWSQAHYEGLQYVEKNVPERSHRLYRERARRRRLRAGDPQPGAQGLQADLHHLVRLYGSDRRRGRGVPGHHVHPPQRLQDRTAPTSATCSARWKT